MRYFCLDILQIQICCKRKTWKNEKCADKCVSHSANDDKLVDILLPSASCNYWRWGSGGTQENINAICILALNVVNDKVNIAEHFIIWISVLVWALDEQDFHLKIQMNKIRQFIILDHPKHHDFMRHFGGQQPTITPALITTEVKGVHK